MAITAGTYTIAGDGSGDYISIIKAFEDTAGLTGNLNLIATKDCYFVDDGYGIALPTMNNFTITIESIPYHNGFKSITPVIKTKGAFSTFYMQDTDSTSGKLEIKNNIFYGEYDADWDVTGGFSVQLKQANASQYAFELNIHHNIFYSVSDETQGNWFSLPRSSGSAKQTFNFYRNIICSQNNSYSYGFVFDTKIDQNMDISIENNVFFGSGIAGFPLYTSIYLLDTEKINLIFQNNIIQCEIECDYVTNNIINSNYIDRDPNDVGDYPYLNGLTVDLNLSDLNNLYESLDITENNYLQLKNITPYINGGSIVLISGNTTGIRQNTFINELLKISIGADQFELSFTYALTADDYFKRYQPYRSEELRNYISIYSRQYAVNTTIEEVGSLDIAIGGGETETYEIEYADVPCKNLYISLESGEYDDETTTYEPYTDCEIISSNLYPCYSTATIKNNASGTVKIKIVIFGSKIYIRSNKATNAIDQTSIDKYGKKEFKIDNNHLIQDPNHSQTLADRLLASYKDPRKDQQLEWRGNPALELGDIVELPEYRRQGQDIKGEYWVTKNQLNYDGTLRANTEYRKKVE